MSDQAMQCTSAAKRGARGVKYRTVLLLAVALVVRDLTYSTLCSAPAPASHWLIGLVGWYLAVV